jgi:guanylate kinase
MSRGHLIVISAPSGAGKTTICRHLRTKHPDWIFSISATTRPRRFNEVNGVDYHFLTETDFTEHVNDEKLVEWETVYDHRYGTSRSTLISALEEGYALLLDVDVKGGVNVKRQYPEDTTAIFIVPPDIETLVKRLKNRGTEDQTSIEMRLKRIPEEMEYKKEFDHIVVNDNLEQAVSQIEAIIMEAK